MSSGATTAVPTVKPARISASRPVKSGDFSAIVSWTCAPAAAAIDSESSQAPVKFLNTRLLCSTLREVSFPHRICKALTPCKYKHESRYNALAQYRNIGFERLRL